MSGEDSERKHSEAGEAAAEGEAEKASLGQVVSSVLAGAIGVQSRANRERDFSQTSFLPFIIGGVIFTVAFVGGLVLLVSLLLN